ncbi:MAG: hypothetical protein HY297_00330 [Thaumarchaeota archaeon]|nr:hypothetical protein [Nitrososphaerota archaeon]
MDYFEAVQKGRSRVKDAIDVLQEVAGPCYPMLFLKIGITEWTPVGEEMLYSVVPGKGAMAAIVICDADGNSKTMTPMVPAARASDFSKALEARGVPKFNGEVKLPV